MLIICREKVRGHEDFCISAHKQPVGMFSPMRMLQISAHCA